MVGEILENIGRNHVPDHLTPQAASWAALAVYLMHDHRPTHAQTAEALDYEKAARAVSHLFPAAETDLITDLAAGFTNAKGYPVDPDAVVYVIGMLVQDDPLARAVDVLEAMRPAWRTHKHGPALLHVWAAGNATLLPAAVALDAIPPGPGTVGVLATSSTGAWTIAIRHEDTFIRIEANPLGHRLWWHYRLGSLTTPTGIARDSDVANRYRIRYPSLKLDGRSQPAVQAATLVGLDLSADLPPECPAAKN